MLMEGSFVDTESNERLHLTILSKAAGLWSEGASAGGFWIARFRIARYNAGVTALTAATPRITGC